MSFRAAVCATPGMAKFYCTGLGAMEAADRPRISSRNTRLLTGSINIDAALRVSQPSAPRWDYGISCRFGNRQRVVWAEVHPASSHHIDEMLSKLSWLRNWLRGEAPRLCELDSGEYHWISTDGRIGITPNSPQAKRLAAAGLRGPVRRLTIG